MAKNINVYCHAIYFNGETRNITTKNGRIYAACFTTPDSNYQPTLPAIDCHVNENIKTIENSNADYRLKHHLFENI